VLKNRAVMIALLALWLAIGPVASAWAVSVSQPCESMSASVPADECCGNAMDNNACLSACMAGAPLMTPPAIQTAGVVPVQVTIPSLSLRYATVLAPPDVAPPKSFVS
jgi:hypothetical protein